MLSVTLLEGTPVLTKASVPRVDTGAYVGEGGSRP